MSLRIRLTFIYATLLGLVLIVFGGAVYFQTDQLLIDQIDQKLYSASADMAYLLYVDNDGRISLQPNVGFDEQISIQLWDQHGFLVLSTDPIIDFTRDFDPLELKIDPLDPEGFDIAYLFIEGTIRTVNLRSEEYRIISIPMTIPGGDGIGILQLGLSLSDVVQLENNILSRLIVIGGIAIAVSIIIGWAASRQALEPISMVTNIASEITHANDLSRRIPTEAITGDEVGNLVHAFNDTMERLEELFNSQEQFLADVGHELRTPLTVMRGNADIMRKMGELDDISLKHMENEIDRMTRMVNDLLFLAQADTGELPLNRFQVELDTLLLEVIHQADILAGENKEIIIAEIDQVSVCGDNDRIKQVILNLLSNAVRYTPKQGTVEVRLGKAYGWAYLSFEDQGPGIPREMIEKIFNRFFRMEEARTRTDGSVGFGLGLPISELIVKTHGGRIAVNSTVGVGTKFIIQLPLVRKNCPGYISDKARDVHVLQSTD